MTSTMQGDTWRRKSGLASWDFQVMGRPEREAETAAWYASTALRLLALLGDFARPARVRLTTTTGGEDAHVVDAGEPGGPERLERILAEEASAVEDIEISLTLLYREAPGAPEAEIAHGATLWLTLEQDADDRASPLRLLFMLDVDLHAPRTWGRQRDNAALAACNGPRLEGFLRRLERELGAELVEIDAPSYQEHVYAHGFRTT